MSAGRKSGASKSESVELIVALAICAGREVGCESDRRIPGCCGIGGGWPCVNVPQGKGEQPTDGDSGLRQLIERGGNIPEEPHACVLLPRAAKDSEKVFGYVDAAYTRNQRIDLLGNSSACAGIDFGPEGADFHAMTPIAQRTARVPNRPLPVLPGMRRVIGNRRCGVMERPCDSVEPLLRTRQG